MQNLFSVVTCPFGIVAALIPTHTIPLVKATFRVCCRKKYREPVCYAGTPATLTSALFPEKNIVSGQTYCPCAHPHQRILSWKNNFVRMAPGVTAQTVLTKRVMQTVLTERVMSIQLGFIYIVSFFTAIGDLLLLPLFLASIMSIHAPSVLRNM